MKYIFREQIGKSYQCVKVNPVLNSQKAKFQFWIFQWIWALIRREMLTFKVNYSSVNKLTLVSMTKLWFFFKELHLIHLSDSYIKSGMKKLIAALPCLQKLYIDAMQCTWNIYCLSEIMQWISVAKELQFLTFKMRSDRGNIKHNGLKYFLRISIIILTNL